MSKTDETPSINFLTVEDVLKNERFMKRFDERPTEDEIKIALSNSTIPDADSPNYLDILKVRIESKRKPYKRS